MYTFYGLGECLQRLMRVVCTKKGTRFPKKNKSTHNCRSMRLFQVAGYPEMFKKIRYPHTKKDPDADRDVKSALSAIERR
jgi:hypothetical protein